MAVTPDLEATPLFTVQAGAEISASDFLLV